MFTLFDDQTLAAETHDDYFSEDGKSGRLVTYRVDGFDGALLDTFMAWAEAQYGQPPNAFVTFATDEEVLAFGEEEAILALGDCYTESALKLWTYYYIEYVSCDLRETPECKMNVWVIYPTMYNSGLRTTYTLEKADTGWAIADRFTSGTT